MSEFDHLIDRTGLHSVKQAYTPPIIGESGHVSMWGAEFEYPTAPFVIEEIVKWAKTGLYAYTVDDEDFRDRVRQWMHLHRGWEIENDWIVPVYGITSSIATTMRICTNPGDGIIGLTPGYHMYWNAIELSDRRKVASRLLYRDGQYFVDWEDLESKMADPENKMLIMCNPHNPLGKVFTEQEISRIADMASRCGIIIYNDEIFAECLYPGVTLTTFNQAAGNDLRVITATSLGKWLSFTGTNQANLIIPDGELRDKFLAERDREFYGSMNPMMIPAYRAAYTREGADWLSELMNYIKGNYELVDTFFKQNIPSFKAVKPQGTFILWVDARDFCADENKLNDFLINKAFFHVDPGSTYGGDEGFFRMALSIPREELNKNLHSLKFAMDQLY